MKAWELLDNEERWTTGAIARDENGVLVDEQCPEACCWCMVGAIWKCYPEFTARQKVIKKMRA